MAQARGTFYLDCSTIKRLHRFSKRSGVPQSTLIDRILQHALKRMESEFVPIEQATERAINDLKVESVIEYGGRRRNGRRK